MPGITRSAQPQRDELAAEEGRQQGALTSSLSAQCLYGVLNVISNL